MDFRSVGYCWNLEEGVMRWCLRLPLATTRSPDALTGIPTGSFSKEDALGPALTKLSLDTQHTQHLSYIRAQEGQALCRPHQDLMQYKLHKCVTRQGLAPLYISLRHQDHTGQQQDPHSGLSDCEVCSMGLMLRDF